MATILVVDDEPPIRLLVARVLERHGHRAIVCADGAQALAVTDVVDLLLVDFVLPDINGRDLTAQVRERQPGLPVILMSGYLQDPALAPPAPSMFLQKPMRPSKITEMIDQMLAPSTGNV